jgi:hypothetical protein
LSVEVKQDGGHLACPKCKNNYLHQVRVVVEFRESEDGSALRTTATGGMPPTMGKEEPPRVQVGWVPGDASAGRRDNVYVEFWCELCEGFRPTLLIQQHKGVTRMGWVDRAPRPLQDPPPARK